MRFPSEQQLDKMDCGPTCLKIVARYFGRFYTLAFLRKICGTTREGVSIMNIVHCAEKIGLKSRTVRCSIKQVISDVPLPFIAHWKQSHFIVVYKVTRKSIYVSDPAQGLMIYDHKTFTRNWYQPDSKKGVLIGLEPEGNFYDLNHDDNFRSKRTITSIIRRFLP